MEDTLTIFPRFSRIMEGSTQRQQWYVPFTCTPSMAFHSAGVMSVNSRWAATPALLTNTRTGPSRFSTAEIMASTCPRSATSA